MVHGDLVFFWKDAMPKKPSDFHFDQTSIRVFPWESPRKID